MKTVIVTGDSRGLGAQIVETLLGHGRFDVVGMSRNGSDRTEAFATEHPDRYHHVEFDLSNVDELPELFARELERRGPFFGLVNNAAMGYFASLSRTTAEDVRRLFDVNVLSPILLSKFVLHDLETHGNEGSLVHVSSVATALGYEGLSTYGATKGALEVFSSGVAREFGERGIRSNCVAPGFMETEMTDALDAAQKDAIYAETGLGEATDPGSVAETVAFLLSDAARSITGEVVRVDAGAL